MLHTHTHTHIHLQLGSLENSNDEENKLTGSPTTNGVETSTLNFNSEGENITENNSHSNLVKLGDSQIGIGNGDVLGSVCVEPTMARFECKDTPASSPVGILHPSVVVEGSKSKVSGGILSVYI